MPANLAFLQNQQQSKTVLPLEEHSGIHDDIFQEDRLGVEGRYEQILVVIRQEVFEKHPDLGFVLVGG